MFQALMAFIPLLSGYVFVNKWHRTRYVLLRQQSQRIYFRAAFWGVWILLLSLGLSAQLSTLFSANAHSAIQAVAQMLLPGVADDIAGAEVFWLLTMILMLLIGSLGGYLLNWCELVRRWPDEWKQSLALGLRQDNRIMSRLYGLTTLNPLQSAIQYLNADFELILLRALQEEKPICLSMSDRKVYVGYLCGAVDPADINDMVRILPYMSGYRSSDTLELHFTDFYDLLYDSLGDENEQKPQSLVYSDFEVALPIREVHSCRLFDTAAYLRFQQGKK